MLIRRQFLSLMLLVMFGLSSLAISAPTLQPLESIREAARSYAQQNFHSVDGTGQLNIEVGSLDPRLRLNYCDVPLESYSPNPQNINQSSTLVGVRCNGSSPWSIFVPITTRNIQNVVVLNHPLQRGVVLADTDVRLEARNISNLTTRYFTDLHDVIGQTLIYSLAAGSIVSANLIKTDALIKRGQTVTILAKSPSLEVRLTGQALSDGIPGQLIKVKNNRTKRIVEGIVDAQGIINVQK